MRGGRADDVDYVVYVAVGVAYGNAVLVHNFAIASDRRGRREVPADYGSARSYRAECYMRCSEVGSVVRRIVQSTRCKRRLAGSVGNSTEGAVGRAVAHFVLQSSLEYGCVSGHRVGEDAACLVGIDVLQAGGIEVSDSSAGLPHYKHRVDHQVEVDPCANLGGAAVRRRACFGLEVSRSIDRRVARPES